MSEVYNVKDMKPPEFVPVLVWVPSVWGLKAGFKDNAPDEGSWVSGAYSAGSWWLYSGSGSSCKYLDDYPFWRKMPPVPKTLLPKGHEEWSIREGEEWLEE